MNSPIIFLPLASLALLTACGVPSSSSEATATQDQKAAGAASEDAPSVAESEAPIKFKQTEDPGYPLLSEQGADASAFVPAGWALVEALKGDLNGDGRPDLAMLMRESDPGKVLRDDTELDTNPYRIAVAFLQADGRTYRLAMENHTLIPRHTNRGVSDPFQDFALKKGVLAVQLHHFANMGGWGMATMKFGFRYQQGGFRLIGYDRIETQRNTGEVESISINYLTGKAKHGKGSIDSEKEATSWSNIPRAPLLRIDQIGDGMGFDPAAERERTEGA